MGTYIRVGSEVIHVVGPYGQGDGTSPDTPLPGDVVERMIAESRVREREKRQIEFMRGPLGEPAELGDPREVAEARFARQLEQHLEVPLEQRATFKWADAPPGERVVPDAVVQERLHQEVDRPRVDVGSVSSGAPFPFLALGMLRAALREVPPGGASGAAPAWIVDLHRAACEVAGIGVRESAELGRPREFEPIEGDQLPVAQRAYAAGRAARLRVDRSTVRELVREAMDAMASTNKATATWPFADRVADYVAGRFAEPGAGLEASAESQSIEERAPADLDRAAGAVRVDRVAGKFIDRKPRKTWDAIRWTGLNFPDVLAWLGPRVDTAKIDPEDPTKVIAWDEDGRARCPAGSWFVQGQDGFVRVLDDESFRKRYEPAPLDEAGFAVASALGMTDNVGAPRPRLLDDEERRDIFDALTFKTSARAGQHQMPAGRYDQLRAALDRVSGATWAMFSPSGNESIELAGAVWRRWAFALLKQQVDPRVADADLRKKIASVLEAPAVTEVDEVVGYDLSVVGERVVAEPVGAASVPRGGDVGATLSARYKQIPPTTKLNPFVVEACARVANAVYREALNSGDPMPSWDDASEDEKASERETVVAALTGVSPATYHARWRSEREAEGWRYGPVKDEVAKVHPNLVNYMQLPAGQRMLDSLFVAAVRATRQAIAEYDAASFPPVLVAGNSAQIPSDQLARFKEQWERPSDGGAWKTPIRDFSVEFLSPHGRQSDLLGFVDDMVDRMLRTPEMWGTFAEIELSIVVLMDVRAFELCGVSRVGAGAFERFVEEKLGRGDNRGGLADRLSRAERLDEFVSLMTEFVAAQRAAFVPMPPAVEDALYGPRPSEAAAKGWVSDPFKLLDEVGAAMGRLTPNELVRLFEEHCECRPTNTVRDSHSHDCDTDVTDDVRTLLHHAVMPGPGEMVQGELRPSTTQEEIVARNRLATFVATRVTKQ